MREAIEKSLMEEGKFDADMENAKRKSMEDADFERKNSGNNSSFQESSGSTVEPCLEF